MPRFISKSTGARSARPNGLALIKKKPSTASTGRSSTLDKRIIRRIESKCGCPSAEKREIVYVGSDDNNLYAFNAETGEEFWSFPTGVGVTSSPAVSSEGKVVYVGSGDTHLYAFNAVTGEEIWSFPTGAGVTSSPAVGNINVYK